MDASGIYHRNEDTFFNTLKYKKSTCLKMLFSCVSLASRAALDLKDIEE